MWGRRRPQPMSPVPGDKSLVAYFVSATDTPPTDSELTSFLRQQLPDYMVPAHFVALESFPRTPNGKLDRKALPAAGAAVFTESAELAAPLTRVEAIVAGIWCEVLGRSRIQPEDDFFMIGGDSLKAVRVVAAVNRTLGSQRVAGGVLPKAHHRRTSRCINAPARDGPPDENTPPRKLRSVLTFFCAEDDSGSCPGWSRTAPSTTSTQQFVGAGP